MSQYPPPPGYQPPAGYQPPGYPPPGYPPQGPAGYGPPGGYGAPIGPPRMSGLAITSLIMGLLGFCVPLIASFLAFVIGIAGIRVTGKPGITGRGLAISGFVLGLLGLLGWGGLGAFWGYEYNQTGAARAVARQFLTDLAANDLTKAQADCDPTMPPATLATASKALNVSGPLNDTTFFMSIEGPAPSGSGTVVSVTGFAHFGYTRRGVAIQLMSEGGVYKVVTFQVQ